jgi:hypothetical protein
MERMEFKVGVGVVEFIRLKGGLNDGYTTTTQTTQNGLGLWQVVVAFREMGLGPVVFLCSRIHSV